MSRDDLAELLNVEEKDVALWEKGLSSPDPSLIFRIAGALGVSASDISKDDLPHISDTAAGSGASDDFVSKQPDSENEPKDGFSLKIVTPVEDELEKGENLIWAGKPTVRQFGAVGYVQLVFGIVWAIVIAVWIIRMISAVPPAAVIGVPLIIYGIYMTVVRLIKSGKTRKSINYAITDRRVIIKCDYKQETVKSIDLGEIKSLRCEEGRNGVGNIIFLEENVPQNSAYPSMGLPQKIFIGKNNRIPLDGFYDVADVVKVCDVFRNLI